MSPPPVHLYPFLAAACLVPAALLAPASSAAAQANVIAAGDAKVSLAWGDCPFDRGEIEEEEGLRIRCGELSVPENWESEGDRTLGNAFTVAELIGQFLDAPERRPDGSCLDELEPRRLVPVDEGR